MKKKLNEASVVNELRGGSLFFPQPNASETGDEAATAQAEEQAPEPKPRKRTTRSRKTAKAAPSAKAEPTTVKMAEAPSLPADLDDASSPVSDDPTTNDSPTGDVERIETIRKAVKQLGKEATFSRLTQEEKTTLGDVVYTYKRSGIRTSENEVIRVAVNWLLEDYHHDGQNSVLARVLSRLHA